jgi:uncharacterized membrane protein YkvA (DUF1232 family)
MHHLMDRLRNRAWQLKGEIFALYLAYRDDRVPWYAKVFGACVVAYAFSPLDLIPDFVPVLGYVDDLILVPLGITLALKMIPAGVMAESRVKARAMLDSDRPKNWVMAGIIVSVWLLLAALAGWLLFRAVRS